VGLKRFKIIFGLSSICGYILITGLFFIFRNSYYLSHAFAQLYNLVIICAWMALGLAFGWLMFLLSLFAVLVQSLFSGFFNLHWQSLVFFAVNLICWSKFKKITEILGDFDSEAEKLQEGKNTAFENLTQKQVQNSALEKKFKRYQKLKEITEFLGSTLSLKEISPFIAERAFELIGKSDACELFLVDKGRQELRFAAAKGRRESVSPLPGEDIFDRWVFKQRSALLVEDALKDYRFSVDEVKKSLPAEEVRAIIAVPLISEDKLIGILRSNAFRRSAFSADDLRLLDIFSDLSAVAIANAELYQETSRLAITDGLTNLYLHRYIIKRLEEEIARSLLTARPLTYLMLDIDHFKKYNDKYGHTAGDIMLKKIAKILTKSVKPVDIVGRYGGEEFALLLIDTPKSEGLKIARKINQEIGKEKFTLRRVTTRVTVSIGVSSCPEDGKLKSEIIAKADAALYKAKGAGRDRVCGA
jgi:diguanylate cyclase (GGDEF)-like protein